MPTLDDVRNALLDAGLAHRAQAVLAHARPSIELRTTPVRQAELAVGESRIGGLPDLPSGLAWPRWNDEPQSFIGQIHLPRLDGFEAARILPPDGWLAFFYSARQDTWGFSPGDRGSATVMHIPEGISLERRHPPEALPDGGAFEACRVALAASWTLPSWESAAIAALEPGDDEIDAYSEAIDALVDPGAGDVHRLLGHPDQIQGDMTVECQLVTHGLDLGDGTGWRDPRAEALARGATDWRLLLQVASDDGAGMMWGDAGCLYYWIREPDLAAAAFDASWLILQCH